MRNFRKMPFDHSRTYRASAALALLASSIGGFFGAGMSDALALQIASQLRLQERRAAGWAR